jgi:predicted  nucleic acid-binding Zn-ribbon protein
MDATINDDIDSTRKILTENLVVITEQIKNIKEMEDMLKKEMKDMLKEEMEDQNQSFFSRLWNKFFG